MLLLALLAWLSVRGAPAHAAFPGMNGRLVCDGERSLRISPEQIPPQGEPNPAGLSRLELYTMNPDGSRVRQLTDNAVRDSEPELAPHGTRIAFDSTRDSSTREIYTINPAGRRLRRLTYALGEDNRPSWSPTGKRLAFQGARYGNFNIFTLGADGYDRRAKLLTTDQGQDSQPAWSPSGGQIAHRANRDGNGEIWTMSANYGEQRGLRQLTSTAPPTSNSFPDWSPDAKRIVFQSNRDGVGDPATPIDDNTEIYTMNPDGGDLRRLTYNAADDPGTPQPNEALDDDPAWSPDGKRIVFESGRSGDVEVYTMNPDGGDPRRITTSPGFDGRCDWGRVSVAAKVPRRCGRRGLRVRVTIAAATSTQRTRVFLDGRRIARSRRASFRVRLPRRRLGSGRRHRLTVVSRDGVGRARKSFRVRACRA